MEAFLESVDTTAAVNNHVCPTWIPHIQARDLKVFLSPRLEKR
jgi:hypothetical protein